jgi:AcrR family transcriptional regulator
VPRPRFENLAPAKRDAILDAATQAFSEHGFEGAVYNEIIAAAGVSKGAMYYYFDDKEDLFTTVVERAMSPVFEALFSLPPAKTPVEFWASLMSSVQTLEPLLVDPHLIPLMRHFLGTRASPAHGPAIAGLYAKIEAGFEVLLEHGRTLGAVRDDMPTSLLLALLMGFGEAGDRWFLDNLESLEPAELHRLFALIATMFRDLAIPPSTSG